MSTTHTTQSHREDAGGAHRRAAAGPVVAMLVVFLGGASVLWATGWMRGRAACDQVEYHLPAIRRFAAELPRPNLHDYPSATTPGYHLVLAAFARAVSSDGLPLQIAASLFTVALLVIFGKALAMMAAGRERNGWELTALALPFAASPYVFTSGVWLLPDNAGWLLVLAALWPLLAGWTTRRMLTWNAMVLVLLVLVRQSHLWAAAPMCAAAWLGLTPLRDESLAGAIVRPFSRVSASIGAIVACVPAIAVVAAFAKEWHGLTPPSFQNQHEHGINWSTFPFILSLIGAFSLFFAGWLWPGITKLWRESRPLVIVAAAAGLVLAVLPETTFLRQPRSSGLWNVVKVLDDAGLSIPWGGHPHTSPLILLLAPLGAVAMAGWIALADDKRRWVIASAIGAFVLAQAANANCWQRYHEPMLLMLFALIAAGFARPAADPELARHPRLAAMRVAGPFVLTACLMLVTIAGLFGRDPLQPEPEHPSGSISNDPGR